MSAAPTVPALTTQSLKNVSSRYLPQPSSGSSGTTEASDYRPSSRTVCNGAAVLMMLWRRVPSVCELTKLLGREDLLWTPKLRVSQQALSKRFLSFPATLSAGADGGVADLPRALGSTPASVARFYRHCPKDFHSALRRRSNRPSKPCSASFKRYRMLPVGSWRARFAR